jgi:hypothetical protein
MGKRLSNDGRNAIVDALATGKDISVDEGAVGDGTSSASVGDASLENELARFATDDRRRATGVGQSSWTVPATSAVDGEDLTEAALQIDPSGDDIMLGRIVYAETPKQNGTRLEYEVDITVRNP